MFTSKERSRLVALSAAITPITQIGKQGVSESFITGIKEALEARELIKLSVLNNAEKSVQEYADEISSATGAQVVKCIGKKIVLYKRSSKEGFKHIEF